jgi:hypothetical protein
MGSLKRYECKNLRKMGKPEYRHVQFRNMTSCTIITVGIPLINLGSAEVVENPSGDSLIDTRAISCNCNLQEIYTQN